MSHGHPPPTVRRSRLPPITSKGQDVTALITSEQHGRAPTATLPTAQASADMGAEWRAKRGQVLSRDKCICGICGKPGANEVDHITPKSSGGSDDLTNLRAVHKACHQRKSSSEGGKAQAEAESFGFGSGKATRNAAPFRTVATKS